MGDAFAADATDTGVTVLVLHLAVFLLTVRPNHGGGHNQTIRAGTFAFESASKGVAITVDVGVGKCSCP